MKPNDTPGPESHQSSTDSPHTYSTGGLEQILEQVWLDGAQLAGGAYLGKKTMRVAEALALIRQRDENLRERLLEAVGEDEEHGWKPCPEEVRNNFRYRLRQAIQAIYGGER